MVLAGASVLLVLALVAGALAVQQQGEAEENAASATQEATSADARAASAKALVSEDVAESMLLAVAGVRLDDSPETRSSLLAALARNPELTASTQMTGAPVISFDVSPDGRTVATYDEVNHVRLYELGTGELLGEYQAGTDRRAWWVSGQVIFSPDGSTLAVDEAAPSRSVVTLLDATTMKRLAVQPETPGRMRWQSLDLVFSRDGRRLAATAWRVEGRGATLAPTTSTWALVWALDEPRRPVTQLRLDGGGFGGLALSPDGETLYTTGPLTIHDLASGTSTQVKVAEKVARLAISPDGRLLAASTESAREVVLLDAATGGLVRRLQRSGEGAYIVAFSGDGDRVATVMTADREAVAWDVRTGRIVAEVPLGESGEAVDFGADGSTLHTAGANRSLRHWDLDGERRFLSEVASIEPAGFEESDARPAPGGERASILYEDQVAFFDVESGTSGPHRDGGGDFTGVQSWHPDGIHFATATGGVIRVWDARSSRLTGRARPSGRPVSQIDYSTDGSRIVIAEESGRLTMLDSSTLTPVGRSVRLDGSVASLSAGPDNHTVIAVTGPRDTSGFWHDSSTGWALADLDAGKVLDVGELGIPSPVVDFSPDGRHAAFGAEDGRMLVLEVTTGRPTRPAVLGHRDSVISLNYSPDGQRLLTGGSDTSVGLWDAEAGVLLARASTSQRLPNAVFGTEPDRVLIANNWGDGPVFEWDTNVERSLAFACRVAGRDFTEVEWQANFGSRPFQETCPS